MNRVCVWVWGNCAHPKYLICPSMIPFIFQTSESRPTCLTCHNGFNAFMKQHQHFSYYCNFLPYFQWFQRCFRFRKVFGLFCISSKKLWKFEFSCPFALLNILATSLKNFWQTTLASQFWWLSCLGRKTKIQIFKTSKLLSESAE